MSLAVEDGNPRKAEACSRVHHNYTSRTGNQWWRKKYHCV